MSGDFVTTEHYTPAMLAELLEVSAATVRQWMRRGWLRETAVVQKLPYFAKTELLAAKRLAQLAKNGLSTAEIAKKLAALQSLFPDTERPLAALDLRIDGRDIFLLKEGKLVDTVGQKLFDFAQTNFDANCHHSDFDANDSSENFEDSPLSETLDNLEQNSFLDSVFQLPHAVFSAETAPDKEELCRMAYYCEEHERLAEAIEFFRAALAAGGPDASICFQLGELLYRLDDKNAARERYYMAVEIDENFVEARANLGCVLSELGELELAASAFQGALLYHPDYADVHYQFALTLQKLGKTLEAEEHFQRWRELTPDGF